MKRALLFPLIALLVASMACSLFVPKPPEVSVPQTGPVVAPQQATKAPVEAPTVVEAEPTKAEPTEAAPEAEPTEAEPTEAEPTEVPPTEEPEPAQATEIKDTFEKDSKLWTDPLVVTSQASGRDANVKITTGSGKMRFSVRDKETYVYKYMKDEVAGATVIEMDYVNNGALNAGIALVCRSNEDHTRWYELRVSGADNFYHFYEYDKQRKEVENKNPYVELSKGVMKYNQFFPMKPNHIMFTCTDTELTVDVNRGKYTATYAIDNLIDGYLFGVGVMSADVVPATIDFETIAIH